MLKSPQGKQEMSAEPAAAAAAAAAASTEEEEGDGSDGPVTRSARDRRVISDTPRGQATLEKLNKLRAVRAHGSPVEDTYLVGECTHKTIWSFAVKFVVQGETFYMCHWDVSDCRSDLYVKPMWNHRSKHVEGVEYCDHLLHLEKASSVMRAIDDPVRYSLKLIEDDIGACEKDFKNPKHAYHLYHSNVDAEETIYRAMLPFRPDHNDAMLESVALIRRCKARGGNLERLFSVLYRSEKDVDKPKWNGRPRRYPRCNSTGTVRNQIHGACYPWAPVCNVCKHRHHQGQLCPVCGHVGPELNPIECVIKLTPRSDSNCNDRRLSMASPSARLSVEDEQPEEQPEEQGEANDEGRRTRGMLSRALRSGGGGSTWASGSRPGSGRPAAATASTSSVTSLGLSPAASPTVSPPAANAAGRGSSAGNAARQSNVKRPVEESLPGDGGAAAASASAATGGRNSSSSDDEDEEEVTLAYQSGSGGKRWPRGGSGPPAKKARSGSAMMSTASGAAAAPGDGKRGVSL
eukprot:COSAG05_NODE_1693_length_4267_cov_2.070298_4_plen_519_part_00